MKRRHVPYVCVFLLLFGLTLGCSGGGGNSGLTSSSGGSSSGATGMVDVVISDDSTQDWATIGVKILSIQLVPQGGGAAVTVYTAPNPAPVINLVQLDQLGELIANAQIPVGTYTGATVTVAANAGDLALTAANDPSAGFAGTAGATVPSGQIEVQGATGSFGSQTANVNVSFASPLVVTANSSNQLDLEIDLSHPAFIVDHTPAGGGTTFWAVNFNGPMRHRPIPSLAAFLLRHMYGKVTAVASNNTSITITRVFATRPAVSPETAVSTTVTRDILADATNGTIFYDVDAKTKTVINNFSSVASTINGKFVRIAARYQVDGSLVAVRIWASSNFNSLWLSPEGHVLHVNKSTNVLTIAKEDGTGVPVTVDGNTQWFFRVPSNAAADATPIATGTSFIQNGNIVRGFKVHVSVVDPLAVPLVAQTVDIEVAKYDGSISSANTSTFDYTRDFPHTADDYTFTEHYASNFKWWFFTFPTITFSGSSGITSFVAAVNAASNPGGSVGTLPVDGTSFNTWNDSANPNGWSTVATILQPEPLPRANVSTAWSATSGGGTFAMMLPGATNPTTVTASNVSGSATLVYQVDRTGLVVTVSPIDLTTSAGQAAVASHLVVGTPVKVFGVPQPDGSIKAYVFIYYTGVMPTVTP